MRIAFVIDDLADHGNGTSVTAQRYAEALRAKGHEVVMVGVGASGEDAFPVREARIPLVSPIADTCGFRFGEPDEAIFDRAFAHVDLIHLFLPFKLERSALAWARSRGVAVSAAFHLQPENVTYNARMGHVPGLASAIYRLFRLWLYDGVRHIHCPSTMIESELRRHHYHGTTHVISNGVPETFGPGAEPAPLRDGDGRIHVLSVGRLAKEKGQASLIRGIARSSHRDEIVLHLAGQGYEEGRLRRLAARLGVALEIGYYASEELCALMRRCPLVVHGSVADIEAISVIEALASGAVPIIAEAPKSAPSQFALTPQSLFPARDAAALADRLDFWIGHPDAISLWRERYLEEAADLRVDVCVDAFVAMAREAIADDRRAYRLREAPSLVGDLSLAGAGLAVGRGLRS